MAKLCRRCGGSGWLLRNPETMTQSQFEQSTSGAAGYGAWFTACSDCTGSGMKGIRHYFASRRANARRNTP